MIEIDRCHSTVVDCFASGSFTEHDCPDRTERNTALSKAGLTALSNTMAGIYFIPFKTGISLQVRSYQLTVAFSQSYYILMAYRVVAVLVLWAIHSQTGGRQASEGGKDLL